MPIDAISVLCAQLTRDLLAIAKFLFRHGVERQIMLDTRTQHRNAAIFELVRVFDYIALT